jgi:hypothetical protein
VEHGGDKQGKRRSHSPSHEGSRCHGAVGQHKVTFYDVAESLDEDQIASHADGDGRDRLRDPGDMRVAGPAKPLPPWY